jgi:hypothetical protein
MSGLMLSDAVFNETPQAALATTQHNEKDSEDNSEKANREQLSHIAYPVPECLEYVLVQANVRRRVA